MSTNGVILLVNNNQLTNQSNALSNEIDIFLLFKVWHIECPFRNQFSSPPPPPPPGLNTLHPVLCIYVYVYQIIFYCKGYCT